MTQQVRHRNSVFAIGMALMWATRAVDDAVGASSRQHSLHWPGTHVGDKSCTRMRGPSSRHRSRDRHGTQEWRPPPVSEITRECFNALLTMISLKHLRIPGVVLHCLSKAFPDTSVGSAGTITASWRQSSWQAANTTKPAIIMNVCSGNLGNVWSATCWFSQIRSGARCRKSATRWQACDNPHRDRPSTDRDRPSSDSRKPLANQKCVSQLSNDATSRNAFHQRAQLCELGERNSARFFGSYELWSAFILFRGVQPGARQDSYSFGRNLGWALGSFFFF